MSYLTIDKKTTARERAWQKALELWEPPSELTVSEWANRYRFLSSESSAESGRFHITRAFFQKGWMDAFSDPMVKEVVLMASSQIGKTESFVNNVISYYIHQDPAPILMVQPSLSMAQTWSKDRFAPMVRDTPALKELIKEPRAKNSENTILAKSFPGGRLTVIGANSPASLASRPIRIVLLDEPDRYPISAGAEGDPCDLAKKRTNTFHNRKIGMCGTPTIKGASRIEAAYLESDQRKYKVPCPHCEVFQVLRWANCRWDKDKPSTAHMVCDSCEKTIEERDKNRMILKGKWEAGQTFTGIAGFHLNELYSPWVRWSEMVTKFLEQKKYPETLKVFINTSLGESFETQGDTHDETQLMGRREIYPLGHLPDGVLVITVAVDVQADRIELEFRGWGLNEESWGLDYLKIPGNPASIELWESLDQQLLREFKTVDGVTLKSACTVVDSGAFTQSVYEYCRKHQPSRVYPIKGSSQSGQPIIAKRSQDKRTGAVFYILGTDTIKDTIFGRLGIEEEGAGYCHFPSSYNKEYFDMLTAEHCVTSFIRGIPTRKWVMKKNKKRNEALDIFGYNFAALKILNVNFEGIVKTLEGKVEGKEMHRETRPRKNFKGANNFVRGFR